jgi:hypothetical protein
MNRVYESHGVRFEYPEDWILHEQTGQDEVSITVNSPETSFWSLTLLAHRPEPDRVIETALDALRAEYSEVDVYPATGRLGESRTVARDVDFVCHDLISTSFLRATRTPRFTLLVIYQGTDFELDETQTRLEEICRSLSWDLSDGAQDAAAPDDAEWLEYLWPPAEEPDSDAADEAKTDDAEE